MDCKSPHDAHRLRVQILWGLTLIALGIAYLAQRDDPAAVSRLWQHWPWVMVAFGINNLLPPTSAKRFVDGLSQVLFGVWFYITFQGWWGLSFRNSWPLLIIVAGVCMVLQPLAARYFPDRKEEQA